MQLDFFIHCRSPFRMVQTASVEGFLVRGFCSIVGARLGKIYTINDIIGRFKNNETIYLGGPETNSNALSHGSTNVTKGFGLVSQCEHVDVLHSDVLNLSFLASVRPISALVGAGFNDFH